MSKWPTRPLGELCRQLTVGFVGKMSDQYVERGVPFLRSQDILAGHIDVSRLKFISPEFHKRIRKSRLQPGDVGIVRTGYPGTAAVVPETLPEANCSDLVIARLGPDLDPRYLAFLLNSPWGKAVIGGRLVGAAQQHFNVKVAQALQVPVPPIEVQRRIVAILGAYDDLIEVNRRRVAVLEEMARGLFEEWFVRFRFPGHEDVPIVDTHDGPMPEGWEWGSLGDVLEERKDKTGPGRHLSDRRYVPIECMGRRTLALPDHQPWENAQSSLQTFEKGDLLFGAMRAYFHKVAPAPFAGITRSTCFVLRPRKPAHRAFALMTLFQDATVAFAAAKSSGSTIPYAKWRGVLEKMPVPRPPEVLLGKFNEVAWPMVEHIMAMTEMNERLAASRDLLLPRLISGQLSVEAAERVLEDAA